ncbi:MAG: serine protease [bacterium]|nr:serine protease [bacterium]
MTLLQRIIIPAISVFILETLAVLSLVRTYPQKGQRELETPSVVTGIATTAETATTTPAVKTEVGLLATTTKTVTEKPRIAEKRVAPPKILTPSPALPPRAFPEEIAMTTRPEAATTIPAVPEIKVPPIDEEELMRAAVRIRCGRVYGSGFVVTPDGLVLTAAHVLMGAIESNTATCDVIFPRKHPEFGYYHETYYRTGTILDPQQIKKFYTEQGFDVAVLKASLLENDPVFQNELPYVKYPFCGADTLDDKILLFGYAANIGTSPGFLGSILSRFGGAVLQYGDVTGVRKEISQIYSGGYDYFPDFAYTLDATLSHSTVIIYSNNNFAGASGGLVFDTSKNCIIGANSAIGTIVGDPRVFGFISNFEIGAVSAWRKTLESAQ